MMMMMLLFTFLLSFSYEHLVAFSTGHMLCDDISTLIDKEGADLCILGSQRCLDLNC